jgi:hypothetical protein
VKTILNEKPLMKIRLVFLCVVLATGSLLTSGCASTDRAVNTASNDATPLPGPDYYSSNDNPYHAD